MGKTNLTKEYSEYNGDYEKKMQDIKTKDGKEYLMCWPNAGQWVVCSSNNIPDIPNKEVIQTRLTHTDY